MELELLKGKLVLFQLKRLNKELLMSLNRKYTQDFTSFGYDLSLFLSTLAFFVLSYIAINKVEKIRKDPKIEKKSGRSPSNMISRRYPYTIFEQAVSDTVAVFPNLKPFPYVN